MKGQVSLEFLIVLAVFFSMLIVSFSILMNVKSTGDDSVQSTKTIITLNDIENSVNEICLLGEGSKKIINSQLESYSLETHDKIIRIKYMNETATAKVICELGDQNIDDIKGPINIKKDADTVLFETN